MSEKRADADPAAFEIVKNSLYKIAEEMRVVLAKTAYSPILKSAGDYSCGVFDAEGSMVAQGPDLPIHLGSMPDAVRAVIAAFKDEEKNGNWQFVNCIADNNFESKTRVLRLEARSNPPSKPAPRAIARKSSAITSPIRTSR